MSKPTDLVQGTLDLLILKVIALEPMHGWAIAQRIRQMSGEVLQVGQSACTRRCTSWNRTAGFRRNGPPVRTTDARSTTRSRERDAKRSTTKPRNGNVWPRRFH